MEEEKVLYNESHDNPEEYKVVAIDVLDGNGEYVNSIAIHVDGSIVFVAIRPEPLRGPARSGKEG